MWVCGSLLEKTSFSDRKATATNGMYSNDLEACGMKCLLFFGSIPKFFSRVLCTQLSDSGPLGLLFLFLYGVCLYVAH